MSDNDDQTLNTTQDDQVTPDVIPSDSEESLANASNDESTSVEDSSSPSAPQNDNSDNLPVEEAGQIEAPSPEDQIDPQVSASEDETSETTEQLDTSNQELGTSSPVPAPTPETPGRWYVVHTYSGHENKVAATLKQRIESEHLEDKIIDVLVPMQDKIEIKGGKKTEVKEKIFPGYILVKMILDDTTWLAVRTTQGVTSFVGIGNKPTPISEKEVQSIIRFTEIQQPTFKQLFTVDDTVKIVDGPFADFIGKVESVDEEKGKVRVLVSIFGRETPVELDFLQVQKI